MGYPIAVHRNAKKKEKMDDGEVEEIKDFKEAEVVIPVPALKKSLEELQSLNHWNREKRAPRNQHLDRR